MSKRGRADDGGAREEEVMRAIGLIRGTPAARGEAEGLSLTPLERQVVALKESVAPHVILLVACGYRVKFYGRDSRVISRRSGIMCIPGQPFEYSSVPYTRVEHYIRRLVAMGYHVGFADQESAAVRAVEGVKSGVFQRAVSQLYSRSTLLPNERIATNGNDTSGAAAAAAASTSAAAAAEGGGSEGDDGADNATGGDNFGGGQASGGIADASELFMCFIELPARKVEADRPLTVVMVSFVTRRREVFSVANPLALEDIIQRFDVVEVVLLAWQAAPSITGYIALLPERYATVLQHTLPLHLGPTANGEEDSKAVSVSGYARGRADGDLLDGAIAGYLRPYKLDRVYHGMIPTPTPTSASSVPQTTTVEEHSVGATAAPSPRSVLALPGSSLRALDVFHSSIGVQGSLLGLVDHSLTPCGSRKLRSWLAAPLASREAILARQAAVAHLLCGGDDGQVEDMLRDCGRVGDVEATIGKLHAQRCGVLEYTRLLRMIRGAHAVAGALLDSAAPPPALTADLLAAVSSEAVAAFIASHQAEMDSTATTPLELFTGRGRTADSVPAAIAEQLAARDRAVRALDAELDEVCATLRLPGLEYRSIAGTSFIIDIPSGKADRVPKGWTVLTRTKTNVRYHTPVIISEHIALCAANDRLVAAAAAAWHDEQARLASDAATLALLNGVVASVAALDALRCLSVASSRPGYVAPRLTDFLPTDAASSPAAAISITGGRHPVLDSLMKGGGYVSCDAAIAGGGAWLLTGPNMGGKSAFMRMVGCFVLLAQMGCYVPAAAATLPVFDGLYCRMGSSDSVLEGSSTFLMEMEETSRILRAENLSRSLVLMDELGRGTSSFDGVAVAAATLEFLIVRRATSVFVTHYNYLCDPYLPGADGAPPPCPQVECYYMGFREETVKGGGEEGGVEGEDVRRLVFTYKPTRGVTPSSFGVDIARMAGLPESVTAEAKVLSAREEKVQTQRMALSILREFLSRPTAE